MASPHVFISAGEPSGDLHGANLVEGLRQEWGEVRVSGLGGPRMQQAGLERVADPTAHSSIGIRGALSHLPMFYGMLRRVRQHLRATRPDAVVLIDCPGLNWWVARAARSVVAPVLYYGVPQLWAWAPWRARKMRRLVDDALCQLPFEEDWFRKRGIPAHYVGHPYFDELSQRSSPRHARPDERPASPLVTLLPGSRTHEIHLNLPTMVRAAQLVRQQVPHVRFAVASYDRRQAELAETIVAASPFKIPVHAGHTGDLIQEATCCIACSGSVSLELLFHAKPSVVVYQCSRPSYAAARRLIRVRYATLVNLMACDNRLDGPLTAFDPEDPESASVPFPEYVTSRDRSPSIAGHVIEWLADPEVRRARVAMLVELRERFAHPGATRHAIQHIRRHIDLPRTGVRPAA